MKIELSGFFDSNFGDDYIMKIIVHYLPEFEFVINGEHRYTSMLLQEKNVSLCKHTDKSLPILIVTGSGFMINSPNAFKHELLYFLMRKHIGDYCMGCNIEPFDSRLKSFLIKKKLSRFKLIICRDKFSYDWLRTSCPHTAVYCLPDILFSIPEKWLPERRECGMLGISIMHRAGDDAECAYYRVMAEAADHWISESGGGVHIMAFDTGTEDDAFACREVRRMMRCPDKADIICHGSGGEIIDAYSECTKVIGARFHSGVLAMRMGIAFYPVIFREKMRRLIRETNYPVKGCDIDNINIAEIKRFLDSPEKSIIVNKDMFREAKMYADMFRDEYNKNEYSK